MENSEQIGADDSANIKDGNKDPVWLDGYI